MLGSNEEPAAKTAAVLEEGDENNPKASPPNVFIGGPVPNPPGFPLKACGNDGLRIGDSHNAAS
jgi:hypothetical protein